MWGQAEACQERAKHLEQAAKEQEGLVDREVREALRQQAQEGNLWAAQEAEALWVVEEGLAHLGLQDQQAPQGDRCNNRWDKMLCTDSAYCKY